MEGGGCLYYVEGLFPDEDYPVAVFVRTFAVKDLPATEAGNLLLDSFELDIEFVGEGFQEKNTITFNPYMSDFTNVTYIIVKLTPDEMARQKIGDAPNPRSWASEYRHFVRVK